MAARARFLYGRGHEGRSSLCCSAHGSSLLLYGLPWHVSSIPSDLLLWTFLDLTKRRPPQDRGRPTNQPDDESIFALHRSLLLTDSSLCISSTSAVMRAVAALPSLVTRGRLKRMYQIHVAVDLHHATHKRILFLQRSWRRRIFANADAFRILGGRRRLSPHPSAPPHPTSSAGAAASPLPPAAHPFLHHCRRRPSLQHRRLLAALPGVEAAFFKPRSSTPGVFSKPPTPQDHMGLFSATRRAVTIARFAGAANIDRFSAVATSPPCTPLCTSGLPGFIDWTRRHHKGFVPSSMHGPLGLDGLPISVDWRKLGAVTSVGDQKQSCWAHGATSSIEGIIKIVTDILPKLSEQQLLDCVNVNNAGCIEGNVIACYRYVIRNGGIVPYSMYPYEGVFNRQHRHLKGTGFTINDYGYKFDITDIELKELVACQPVVAALGADEVFCAYTNEVIDGWNYTLKDMEQKRIGHIVTIIGYGRDLKSGLDFWLAKNSWSELFGQTKGYVYIRRNCWNRFGAFGINNFICYPTILTSCSTVEVMVRSESQLGMGLPWYQQIGI